jgi:hypothetical protein
MGRAKNLFDKERCRLLGTLVPPRLKVQFRRANSTLVVIVIHAKATRTEIARVRISATMVAPCSTMPKTAP